MTTKGRRIMGMVGGLFVGTAFGGGVQASADSSGDISGYGLLGGLGLGLLAMAFIKGDDD